MRLLEILRLVWLNIMENKSKVMLTSLGIIVGSATIVLVIAIGKGGQADVAEQFKNLNAGAIDVKAVEASTQNGMPEGGFPGGGNFTPPSPGGSPGGGFGGGNRGGGGGGFPSFGMSRGGGTSSRVVRLDEDDVSDIAELVPGLEEVTMLMSKKISVYGGDLEEEMEATVVGTMENYLAVGNLKLLYGDFFTEEENEANSYVAVIGYGLAEEIFTYPAYAYEDYITIEGKNYKIIGVLSEMGAVSSGISSDDAIYVPYNTGVKYIFGNQVEPTITAVASDVTQVESVMENIKTVLTENHPKGNFSLTDAGSAMDAAQSSANTLAMLLFAVATIVFIVGGIGIMNVLFVSVKERTPEIGILKAIGCPASTILLEFLLEAVFMGLVGGILGVAVSFGLIPLLEMFGMRLEATPVCYLMALAFALVTGTVFGFYPATKASKLVPIEALTLN